MSRASRAIPLLQGLIKTVSGEAGVASALARPAIPCLASSAQHGLSAICRSVATGSAQVSGRRQASLLANLKQLSKFRLSSLVVLTASAGYVMGSGERVDLQGLLWTSLGTFGAAACANTLNQIYEVANDRAMSRTCNRPLPAGRMTRLAALAFAVAAGGTGLATLHYMVRAGFSQHARHAACSGYVPQGPSAQGTAINPVLPWCVCPLLRARRQTT